MLTAAPASVSDRFGEALRPGVMGPRLAAAQGGMPGACHVLDAKFEPGVRAVLLYEQAGRLLRGDLVPDGGRSGADPARMVEPGVLVSPFPHDPELPSLPSVMDPACLGRAMAGARGEATARVFCQEFHAELVSVAGVFRVFETIPPELKGHPVQAWLSGDELRFARIGA